MNVPWESSKDFPRYYKPSRISEDCSKEIPGITSSNSEGTMLDFSFVSSSLFHSSKKGGSF
jgi:hypothetical protein